MSLPAIRSVRNGEVKIGRKVIKFQPWSNRDIITYESRLDDITKESKASELLDKTKNLIYEILVKPNLIDYDKELTPLEKEIVYVEIYKLSRGNLILMNYTCGNEECGHKTEVYFDIEKHYKYIESKVKHIKTSDFVFYLKNSTYVPDEDETDMLAKNAKYYASFIKEFEYKGTKYNKMELDELADWLVNELDETNFKELVEELDDALPKIEMKMNVTCELCGYSEEFVFSTLPDFSIVQL